MPCRPPTEAWRRRQRQPRLWAKLRVADLALFFRERLRDFPTVTGLLSAWGAQALGGSQPPPWQNYTLQELVQAGALWGGGRMPQLAYLPC